MSRGEACRFETLVQSPDIVRSLSEGAEGRVWIGTSGGLIEFTGEVFRRYSEQHPLLHGTINAVAEDRVGGVWIGTDAGGVVKLTRNGFASFSEQDGLRHDYVTSIAQGRTGRPSASISRVELKTISSPSALTLGMRSSKSVLSSVTGSGGPKLPS